MAVKEGQGVAPETDKGAGCRAAKSNSTILTSAERISFKTHRLFHAHS